LLDKDLFPRIADFGVARFNDSNTGMTSTIGTPDYIAPELILGEKSTNKVDVSSFAMILYEMIEGIRPGPNNI
jgi:serine/threonine protein kinase